MSTHLHTLMRLYSFKKSLRGSVGGMWEISRMAEQGSLLTASQDLTGSLLSALNCHQSKAGRQVLDKRWLSLVGQSWYSKSPVLGLRLWLRESPLWKCPEIQAHGRSLDEEAAKYEGLWLGRQSSTFLPAWCSKELCVTSHISAIGSAQDAQQTRQGKLETLEQEPSSPSPKTEC